MTKGVLVSPVVLTFGDYLYDSGSVTDPTKPDHAVQITVNFDNATFALINAVVWRAADCLWHTITIGLGVDGSPNSSTKTFNLSTLNDASRTVTAAQMAASPYFFTTIQDVLAAQITAF